MRAYPMVLTLALTALVLGYHSPKQVRFALRLGRQ